jgi:transcription termination/antitermination protein NusG
VPFCKLAGDNKLSARWYIVHAYSNFEKKVAEQIKETAIQKGLGHKVEQILVPSEEITETVRGRKKVTERRFFPGYVLVKMELDDATYHLVKDTPKVTGFLGADAGKRPTPVSEKEVQRILGVVEEGGDRPAQMITFDLGEKVRVTDGPFASFEGLVEEVDEGRQRLKVAVSIFGRATPVELEYAQVEKLS